MSSQNKEKQKINILNKKDLDISYFIGSGPGGQNKQKNTTGVQLVHKESGAIGRCSDYRSLEQNKKSAFLRLCESAKFKIWLSGKVYQIRGVDKQMSSENIKIEVDKQMSSENLKIEVKDSNGKWIVENENN